MKTGFDVITDVRSLVNVEQVTGLITGKIWANQRLNNSDLIDVVINCNSISNTQRQIGYGNINIYVPALTIADANGGQQSYPDQATLGELCDAITQLVDSQSRATFTTIVQDSGNIYQDTDGTWFANIGFKYTSIQEDFKNI